MLSACSLSTFPVFIPVSAVLTYRVPQIPALTHQEKGTRADSWDSQNLSCLFSSQAGDTDNSLTPSFFLFLPFSLLIPGYAVIPQHSDAAVF